MKVSYADILKALKAKVDPQRAGLEVLSIRRTSKLSPACDATRLLQLGKVRIGWVACRIRKHAEVA